METSITIMHGYTCSSKTTTSEVLAAWYGLRRIETKEFGAITSEAEKLRRYEQLAGAAETVLESGNSVILDGTFSKYECRNRIYRLAERSGIQAVTIIHCVCGDDEEVLRRLWGRKKNEGICTEEWRARAHDGLEMDKARFERLRIIRMDTTDSKCYI
jgi:predicted kinase